MNNPYEELRLDSLLKSCLRKYKYFIISFVIASVLLGGFLALKTLIKPEYISDSVVLLYSKNTSSDLEKYVMNGKLGAKELATLKDAASSYINLINNRLVIYRVLDKLNIQMEDVEEFISEDVDVTNINASPYLDVSITYRDAQTAYEINNEIIAMMPEILKDLNIEANFAVVSNPILPTKPDLPDKMILAAIAGGFGLLLGFLLVLLHELFYATFRTEKDIERVLHIENLGYVPRICSKQTNKDKEFCLLAYSKVIINLILSRKKVIVFAGESKDESNKKVVHGIFLHLIKLGYATLLIDAEKPAKNDANFQSLIKEGKYYININKSIADRKYEEASALFTDLLATHKDSFDFLLCNVPIPVHSLGTLSCFTLADVSILMIQHDKTKQKAAQSMLDIIQKAGCEDNYALTIDVAHKGICNYYRDLAI